MNEKYQVPADKDTRYALRPIYQIGIRYSLMEEKEEFVGDNLPVIITPQLKPVSKSPRFDR